MNVPIRRGTARRLGLRLPRGTYYAPLRWAPLTEADLSDFTTKLVEAVRGWKPGTWLGLKP